MEKPTLEIPPFVTLILDRLEHAGHRAFIVGGAVRDACLDRPVYDWDVATSAAPEQITAIFEDIRSFTLKHGTVTLVDSGSHFEVTPFRGAAPVIEEDLAHRDFTINAMAFDRASGRILDPCGGMEDMARKRIRATGEPEARFREDPLRLLRAVRLSAELGFQMDPETLEWMTSSAYLLGSVARERVRDELLRVLVTPRPSGGFKLMRRTGVLEHFLPEILEGYRRKQNVHHRFTVFRHIMETMDGAEPTPVLRLTALFHDIAKPRVRKKVNGEWRFIGHEEASAAMAEEIMNRLRFGRDMIRKVVNITRHHMIGYDSSWSDAAVRRLIKRVGLEDMDELLLFHRADLLAHGIRDQKLDLLEELSRRVHAQTASPPATRAADLAVDGDLVMKTLGLQPGPEVGKVLEELTERVLDQPELNTPERLLRVLKAMKKP
jgi:tRNA nucleotidyltransferase (CCA-adding enzyme)